MQERIGEPEVEERMNEKMRELTSMHEQSLRERVAQDRAEVEEGMDRKIRELICMHERSMCERVAQDKAEYDVRIRDMRESHEKQIVAHFCHAFHYKPF